MHCFLLPYVHFKQTRSGLPLHCPRRFKSQSKQQKMSSITAFIVTLILIAIESSPSFVSALNQNLPSSYSYCSYIFINKEELPVTRSTRSTEESGNEAVESGPPTFVDSHRHSRVKHHHQTPSLLSRPYSSTLPTNTTTPTTTSTTNNNNMNNITTKPLFHGLSTPIATETIMHTRARHSRSQSSTLSRRHREVASAADSTIVPSSSIRLDSNNHHPGTDLYFKANGQIFDKNYQQMFQNQFQFSYLPPKNSHPVFIGLEIIDVDLINDAKNFFSLQLHLFELWHEPRLNTTALQMFWDTNSDPFPVNEAGIADCLWTPSLVFEDSSESEQLLPPTTILLAYKDKVLLRKSRHSLKVRCHMNLQIYPMDKHYCHFKLRTFTDPVHKVDLRWIDDVESPKRDLLDSKQNKSVIHSAEFTPSLFDIKVGNADRLNHVWLNENYSLLDVQFIFERRIIHTMLTVYIPSTLVVTLSWLQFWFDVEAVPGRMSLGIMSTLTIMTQILTNYEKAGNHVTAVDIWLFVCLIMVFLALMEYAVAYTFSHYYDDPMLINYYNSTLVSGTQQHKIQPIGPDSVYNKNSDPFYTSGPLQANLLRNSIRNRGNTTPAATAADTPVVDIDSTKSNLFRMKTLPQSSVGNGGDSNITPDPQCGSSSKNQIEKGLQPPQAPTSQQHGQLDDEERSKLLSGHRSDEDHGGLLQNRLSPEQLEQARIRMENAIEEFQTLKDELDERSLSFDNQHRAQPPQNSVIIPERIDTRLTDGHEKDKAKKRKRTRNQTDNNNNRSSSACSSCKGTNQKLGRFSSLRRPTLRRQLSSRSQIERSPSGLSEVDYCSRFIFPISFVLFVVIYWIVLSLFKIA